MRQPEVINLRTQREVSSWLRVTYTHVSCSELKTERPPWRSLHHTKTRRRITCVHGEIRAPAVLGVSTADLTEDTPHYRVVLLQMIRPRVRYNKKRKVKQPKRNVSRYTIMSSVCLSLLHTALIVTVELLSRGQSSSAAVRVCWCFVLCFVCVRLKSNVLPFYFYVDT